MELKRLAVNFPTRRLRMCGWRILDIFCFVKMYGPRGHLVLDQVKNLVRKVGDSKAVLSFRILNTSRLFVHHSSKASDGVINNELRDWRVGEDRAWLTKAFGQIDFEHVLILAQLADLVEVPTICGVDLLCLDLNGLGPRLGDHSSRSFDVQEEEFFRVEDHVLVRETRARLIAVSQLMASAHSIAESQSLVGRSSRVWLE